MVEEDKLHRQERDRTHKESIAFRGNATEDPVRVDSVPQRFCNSSAPVSFFLFQLPFPEKIRLASVDSPSPGSCGSSGKMSFVFRGSRGDLESGFSGFMPERRAMRIHAARPVNSNSLAFLVTVLLLFMILNSHQMPPNFLLWLVLGVFLMATTLRMYATCQQLQAQAQAHAAAASGLFSHTELRLHMPPSIALATRGRLQGLRLQLALLDREFDDLDYETLRALDSDNVPTTASMTEEEINALPVHKYKVSGPQNGCSSGQQASTSSSAEQKKQDSGNGSTKGSEDELTCSVCLEQVNVGELVRSLPCLHQFHASCIDPWLRQQGTCPVCKFRAGSGWQEMEQDSVDASDMV